MPKNKINKIEGRTICITETDGKGNIVRGPKFEQLSDLINSTEYCTPSFNPGIPRFA